MKGPSEQLADIHAVLGDLPERFAAAMARSQGGGRDAGGRYLPRGGGKGGDESPLGQSFGDAKAVTGALSSPLFGSFGEQMRASLATLQQLEELFKALEGLKERFAPKLPDAISAPPREVQYRHWPDELTRDPGDNVPDVDVDLRRDPGDGQRPPSPAPGPLKDTRPPPKLPAGFDEIKDGGRMRQLEQEIENLNHNKKPLGGRQEELADLQRRLKDHADAPKRGGLAEGNDAPAAAGLEKTEAVEELTPAIKELTRVILDKSRQREPDKGPPPAPPPVAEGGAPPPAGDPFKPYTTSQTPPFAEIAELAL